MNRNPIVAALLLLSAAPGAWAQQAAPSNEPAPSTLPTVKVQGDADQGAFNSTGVSLQKLPADPHDMAQSVTIINKALLQSQGATSLSDALRNVPGITLGAAEGGQIGNNINLNGFTARTDIYLDGMRDRGQYYRDVFALESVEVLMGPSSMLFGRGSTGGVVNQVPKKPGMRDFTDVGASVTTNGMVRTTIDHNQKLDDTSAFRVAAMAQDGHPTTRDVMKNRDFGVAPSIMLGINTPTEITLSALLQHNRDMPDYGVPPLNGAQAPVGRNTFYGFTSDRLVQDVIALDLNVNHRISSESSWRNQIQYNDVRINAIETAPQTLGTIGANGFTAFTPANTTALPVTQIGVRLQSHDRVIHDKSLYDNGELKLRFGDDKGIKQDVLLGFEVGHDSYYNQTYTRTGSCNGVALASTYVGCVSLVNSATTSQPAGMNEVAGNRASAVANGAALYVNDTAQLGPQFKLVAGVRHDYYKATINNSINSTNTAGNTTLASQSQSVTFDSVRLGGIWQPTSELSTYLSYSTSFNPSLEQLTITTGTSSPLPPEKNKSYEAGAKWDSLDGHYSANGAVFQITQNNSRAQNADGTYQATGTIRVNGLRLGASGELARGWKVFGGYAHLDATIVDGVAVGTQGKTPLNTPKNSGTLWTTYAFAPHWEIGGGAQFMGQRYANNTNTIGVPSYARWDATLAWHQKDYDLRLNVFNLTNKYFYDSIIASDGGRAVPGIGRSAMLSILYHL